MRQFNAALISREAKLEAQETRCSERQEFINSQISQLTQLVSECRYQNAENLKLKSSLLEQHEIYNKKNEEELKNSVKRYKY